MASVTHSQTITGVGLAIQTLPVVRTNSGPIGLEDTLTAAKSGTLTTRTLDTSGTLTMATGHGITTGQRIDVYWSGGVQYGCLVGTVSVDSVPISGGSGDVLPIAATAITAAVQSSINLAIDGDVTNILAVVVETTTQSLRTAAHIQFRDVGNAQITEIDLVTNVPVVWDITGGVTNPFTGNPITNLKASQANVTTTEIYTLKIIGVQDASP